MTSSNEIDKPTMTKSDRSELKQLLKRRYKQLKADIDARAQEMAAEVNELIVERHRDRDNERARLESQVAQILLEANTKAQELLDAAGYELTGRSMFQQRHQVRWGDDGKHEMRRAAISRIESQVAHAKAELERQETQNLQTLILDSLQTDAALHFMNSIPTVAALVPASRMKELEAMLTEIASEQP